jgi:pyruvate/oxaloacetate carboxyltransferase
MIKKAIRHDFDYVIFDDFWQVQDFQKYIDLIETMNKNNCDGICFKDAYRVLKDSD